MATETPSPSGFAELKIDGRLYGGWKTVSVTRSIEQIAGTFSLDVTDRWGGSAAAWPIKPGARAQLLLDGDTVIDGYVDDAEPSYDSQNAGLRVAGRDRTGDLVDCSAIYKTGQWRGATLDRIARDLIAPFGIGLRVEADVGEPFASYAIQEGETVFECLERAARMRAVLLVSDTAGNLVIARAGDTLVPAALVEGQNILAARATFSWKDRHSRYLVKGQAHATDDFYAEQAAGPSGEALDGVINRHRPLVVLAEEHGAGGSLAARAAWEASVRFGRGNRATITVQGWRRPDGALWQPNTLVAVQSPRLYLDAPMLIVGCTWRLDDAGTFTDLTISRREAFVLFDGIGSSRLRAKLNHKTQSEKRKKGDDYSAV